MIHRVAIYTREKGSRKYRPLGRRKFPSMHTVRAVAHRPSGLFGGSLVEILWESEGAYGNNVV